MTEEDYWIFDRPKWRCRREQKGKDKGRGNPQF